jgi:hypothetical protein
MSARGEAALWRGNGGNNACILLSRKIKKIHTVDSAGTNGWSDELIYFLKKICK